jgi:hypothetical protein
MAPRSCLDETAWDDSSACGDLRGGPAGVAIQPVPPLEQLTIWVNGICFVRSDRDGLEWPGGLACERLPKRS